MKYFLHMKGSGGCDYTVSCNETVLTLDASNQEEAMEVAKELLSNYYDQGINFAKIIPSEDPVVLPVKKWKAELREQEAREREEARVQEKRRLYEELKAQFEG